MRRCHACHKEIQIEGKIGRREPCPHCGADLHCCLNCRFYDEHAHNQCREPLAEWVPAKDRANLCDYFEFMEARTQIGPSDRDRAEALWQELFKKKSSESV